MRQQTGFIFLILFVALIQNPGIADENNSNPYPVHLHHCLEALNYHMDSEKEFAVLMGVKENDTNGCKITAVFRNKENINKFNEARVKQGKSHSFVMYKEHKIEIVKSIGNVVPH